MFGFLKKPKEKIEINTDIHSHLIPGIDDGASSMDESIALVRRFAEMGYKRLITTPHTMADYYQNTPEIILQGLAKLREEIEKEGIDIDIDAASEYYLDDGFDDLLERGDLLTFGDNYLLFETSYVERSIALEETIFKLLTKGYKPVLAHPERYRYIKDMSEYNRLKETGVLFQINITSFGGHYGKSAKQKAQFLSRNGMIDLLGSDAHSLKHLDALEGVLRSREYAEIFVHNDIGNNKL